MIVKGIVMGEKRLLVMFPGVGYHCDKPLLYYGRKIAREAGYEDADHSLETGDILSDLDTIREVMEKTNLFCLGKESRRIHDCK